MLNADVCPEEQIMDALNAMTGVGKENCVKLLTVGQGWVACMDASANATGMALDSHCDDVFPTQKQICDCMSHVPEDVAWEFDCKFHPEHSSQMIHAYWASCTHQAGTCEAEDIMNELDAMSGKAKENCMSLLTVANDWVACEDDPPATGCSDVEPTNEQICDCLGAVPEDIAWEYGLWCAAGVWVWKYADARFCACGAWHALSLCVFDCACFLRWRRLQVPP